MLVKIRATLGLTPSAPAMVPRRCCFDTLSLKKIQLAGCFLVIFHNSLGLPCIAREACADRCCEAYLMSAHGVTSDCFATRETDGSCVRARATKKRMNERHRAQLWLFVVCLTTSKSSFRAFEQLFIII